MGLLEHFHFIHKTLGAIGDAGAVLQQKTIYEDLLKLRNHGHIDRDNFKFSEKTHDLMKFRQFFKQRLKTIKNEIDKRVILQKIIKRVWKI